MLFQIISNRPPARRSTAWASTSSSTSTATRARGCAGRRGPRPLPPHGPVRAPRRRGPAGDGRSGSLGREGGAGAVSPRKLLPALAPGLRQRPAAALQREWGNGAAAEVRRRRSRAPVRPPAAQHHPGSVAGQDTGAARTGAGRAERRRERNEGGKRRGGNGREREREGPPLNPRACQCLASQSTGTAAGLPP